MSSLRLTRSIKPSGHAPLYTIDEACAYVVSLPGQVASMPAWECAARLALEARENPTEAALDEFTCQLEIALFLAHRLDLSYARGALDTLFDRTRKQPPRPAQL
jgi:hypothetical protein